MITSNFDSFFKEFTKEKERQLEVQKASFKEIVFTTFTIVNQGSPVLSGYFRANNFLSEKNTTNKIGDENNINQDNLIDGKRIIDNAKIKHGDSMFIQNNLPYAEKLENGGSNQAPRGIYSVSIEKMRAAINKQQREVIK